MAQIRNPWQVISKRVFPISYESVIARQYRIFFPHHFYRFKKKWCSHENSAVQLTYEEFLGEPNSHRAHQLLHTNLEDWDLEMNR